MSVLSKTIDYEALWVSIPYPCFVIGRNNQITAANYSAETLCLQSLKNILSQSIDWYLGENSLVKNAIISALGVKLEGMYGCKWCGSEC